MNEPQARNIAEILGGRIWQSGGGLWLVIIDKANGELVVISDEVVCEYNSEKNLEEAKPSKAILLRE
jgi:hypothetical protein